MNRIINADVFEALPTLPAGGVDVVCTSPPYFALRSYLPKDHALKRHELGSEKTPEEYVARMVEVFALVKRALADHGTCWLNIGDSYSTSGGADPHNANKGNDGRTATRAGRGLDSGSLCLIPQRLALALQADGWLCRSLIVWHKPAPMPASLSGWRWARHRVKVKRNTNHDTGKNGEHPNPTAVGFNDRWKDSATHSAQWSDCPGCGRCTPHGGYVLRRGSWRPTSAWEPILMLAKRQGYYADGEAVKTEAEYGRRSAFRSNRYLDGASYDNSGDYEPSPTVSGADPSAGANARDVQSWAAEPLKEKHYAAFPTALAAWCLRAGTSAKGYCPACGMPWARVVQTTFVKGQETNNRTRHSEVHGWDNSQWPTGTNDTQTLGWRPTCAHDLPPRPGLVLDPFCGSGRTGVAASWLGLDFVGVELHPEYADVARKILYNQMPLFA